MSLFAERGRVYVYLNDAGSVRRQYKVVAHERLVTKKWQNVTTKEVLGQHPTKRSNEVSDKNSLERTAENRKYLMDG